ncbi:hypothetical protein BDF20DRAFT_822667 [Mycotypha africana]|uniref:uncharacterized protein n=1 Tax=Mycotypha africana TaxID=64632 RepID=UPI002301EF46|nr:uncharacterized protein BDF20DRAFT_822667 [Mycotypha africana]KAI8975332.1 hypothetical protein BDF20DRAFT_822667 [Mycotypha africana]
MRRADIIVSRDNPQHLHQQSISNLKQNEDEETTVNADESNGLQTDMKPLQPTEEDDKLLYEKKKSIVILLGRLLLKCGCPCHRVDEILQQTAKIIGVDAGFTFLPDAFIVTFALSAVSQSVMVKAPQGFDNGKIAKINDIMNMLFRGIIDLDRCLVLLHDVATAPPTCGVWHTLFFFAMGSFTAAAMLFNGSWIDAAVSGALGLLVAMLFLLSAKFPIFARVFELTASALVAIIAKALHQYCCFKTVALASLLILLPGYTMTVGVVGSTPQLLVAKQIEK